MNRADGSARPSADPRPAPSSMAAPPPPRRPRRPPELMDDLVEEILLRLPPDEPAHLARAALVGKRWCRLVTDPGFRRRFRHFHRTPPMLGLIICSRGRATATRFLPTSSFLPSDAGRCRSWSPLDARHGRILFCYDPVRSNPARKELTVWTPVTGEVRKLPRLVLPNSYCAYWNAALLCGAPGCDHMECPAGGGPFTVVLVGRTMFQRSTKAYVYSSEADKWSQTASVELHWYVEQRCNSSALVGNALYFLLQHSKGILEYHLSKKELSSAIGLPSICSVSTVIVLMSVEDDRLGFAMVNDNFSLCIWLGGSAPTPSGGWTWTKHKVVDLKGFLPVSALSSSPYIIAAADAVGVFVIWAGDAGAFAIDLKSGRRRMVSESFDADARNVNIIPYMSFCTPAFRACLHR